VNPQYKRTPTDIAHEYVAVLRTIATRKSRLPASAEGLRYAAAMDAIANSVACCVRDDNPALLVATPEELATAERALEAARGDLMATLDEFKTLDIKAQSQDTSAISQIVTPQPAGRAPIANDAA
jgi:hypothetical protein